MITEASTEASIKPGPRKFNSPLYAVLATDSKIRALAGRKHVTVDVAVTLEDNTDMTLRLQVTPQGASLSSYEGPQALARSAPASDWTPEWDISLEEDAAHEA